MQQTYLMVNNRSGYHKIGRSNNPGHRERTLQCQEPDVKLLATCAVDIESKLHNKYRERRMRGEWFYLSEFDANAIKELFSFLGDTEPLGEIAQPTPEPHVGNWSEYACVKYTEGLTPSEVEEQAYAFNNTRATSFKIFYAHSNYGWPAIDGRVFLKKDIRDMYCGPMGAISVVMRSGEEVYYPSVGLVERDGNTRMSNCGEIFISRLNEPRRQVWFSLHHQKNLKERK